MYSSKSKFKLQAPYLCEGEGASNCGTVLSSLTGE